MSLNRTLDLLWLLLLGVTLLTTAAGEGAPPGLAVTVFIAVIIAVKGRLIVDHFMELRTANRHIRRLMNLYFYVFPVLLVLVELFPHLLKEWTTL